METKSWTLELVTLVIGGAAGWFTGWRKTKAELKVSEVDTLQKAMQVLMTECVEPLRLEVQELRQENKELKAEIKLLRSAIQEIHNCEYYSVCPVRDELRQQEKDISKGSNQAGQFS